MGATFTRTADRGHKAWSYYADNSPEAGIFGIIAKVTAREASATIGGTSIAAHVHHAAFALDASAAWMSGPERKYRRTSTARMDSRERRSSSAA